MKSPKEFFQSLDRALKLWAYITEIDTNGVRVTYGCGDYCRIEDIWNEHVDGEGRSLEEAIDNLPDYRKEKA